MFSVALRRAVLGIAATPVPARAFASSSVGFASSKTPSKPSKRTAAPPPSSPDTPRASTPSPEAVGPAPTPSAESGEPIPVDRLATGPSETPSSPPSSSSSLAKASPSLAQSTLNDLLLTPEVEPEETFGETTGAKAKSNRTKSSIEKRRANLSKALMAFGALGLVGFAVHSGRDWEEGERDKLMGRSEDEEGKEWLQRQGLWQWAGRARLRVADQMDYLNKPAWDPLLPPPLPEPHYRPYTLVIDLDDLLVHSSWDTEHGWRTAKRPGVDYFLAYLSQFYEIVLFTTQPAYTAIPIVEKLDPYGAYIPWKLFRDSTRYKNKMLIKDLSYLGRPLNRTVILDTLPTSVSLQQSNAILLPPWHGRDTPSRTSDLIALIPFLEALAIKNVPDVRTVIAHYEGKDVAKAYAEAEAEQKKALKEKWEAERKSVVWSALGGLVKSQSKDAPPETDVEKVRKRAQALYLEEQKYWKDNQEVIKTQMEEDRARQLKEMKGSLLGFMGLQGPPGSKPEEKKA